jgi:hypothetical protein
MLLLNSNLWNEVHILEHMLFPSMEAEQDTSTTMNFNNRSIAEPHSALDAGVQFAEHLFIT